MIEAGNPRQGSAPHATDSPLVLGPFPPDSRSKDPFDYPRPSSKLTSFNTTAAREEKHASSEAENLSNRGYSPRIHYRLCVERIPSKRDCTRSPRPSWIEREPEAPWRSSLHTQHKSRSWPEWYVCHQHVQDLDLANANTDENIHPDKGMLPSPHAHARLRLILFLSRPNRRREIRPKDRRARNKAVHGRPSSSSSYPPIIPQN
jgi:hypothetical protein